MRGLGPELVVDEHHLRLMREHEGRQLGGGLRDRDDLDVRRLRELRAQLVGEGLVGAADDDDPGHHFIPSGTAWPPSLLASNSPSSPVRSSPVPVGSPTRRTSSANADA